MLRRAYFRNTPRRSGWSASERDYPHVQNQLLIFWRERQRCTSFSHSFSVSTVLLPPLVFASLFVTLWGYKCAMMVVFQNKIIYMPYLPPYAKSEKIANYASQFRGVSWRQHQIQSADGTRITLAIGTLPSETKKADGHQILRQKSITLVAYFQGNASSLPPRLPSLSQVLSQTTAETASCEESQTIHLIAVSYRGFWTSHGRPSQKGIELDAAAVLAWINDEYSGPASTLRLFLWGQSIGAGVATVAAANYLRENYHGSGNKRNFHINGLVLETPFISIRHMLATLYPQKWLPYRYLGPFLRNHWDSERALTEISRSKRPKPKVLILQAGKDEIVSLEHGVGLEVVCRVEGIDVKRKVVVGALHTDTMSRPAGRSAVTEFLSSK